MARGLLSCSPFLVFVYKKIHHHYEDVRDQLILSPAEYKALMAVPEGENIIVIPVAAPTKAVARAIRYAKICIQIKSMLST